MPTIAVSHFVKRQTPQSPFSHYDGDWDEVLRIAHTLFCFGKQGYRDGVLLVPIPADKCYTNIVQLQPGDKFAGEFSARQTGEAPRKSTYVIGGKKMPAKSAMLVLYRHDVLLENNEQSCDADWEIISLNASPFEQMASELPMSVGTLLANHFQLSGGTATNMSNDDFVRALRMSVEFWKDKAMVAPANLAVVDHEWLANALRFLQDVSGDVSGGSDSGGTVPTGLATESQAILRDERCPKQNP